MSKKIRCACGKSQVMPWCDGSHKNENWACEPVQKHQVNRAFFSTSGLLNLAKRLAWRFDGDLVMAGENVQGKRLIVIDDGSSLPRLKESLSEFKFEQTLFVGIDLAAATVANALDIEHHLELTGSLTDIYVQLESTVEQWYQGRPVKSNRSLDCPQLNKMFISHAVADETLLLPMANSLRELTEMDVFMCFDSIEKGEKWRRQIESALRDCELFVMIVSKSSIQSTYCAFETGSAISLGKPICLISIDGSLPPAYISQIHCIDLMREIAAKPWLDIQSALMLQLLAYTEKMCHSVKAN